MGAEMQGGINITLRADRSCNVTVRLGETLNADGTVKVPMYTGNIFEDVWTLRPGQQTVVQHEYMEFRWAEIINAPEPIDLNSVGGWVVRYPLASASGGAEAGDPKSETFLARFGSRNTEYSNFDTAPASPFESNYTRTITTADSVAAGGSGGFNGNATPELALPLWPIRSLATFAASDDGNYSGLATPLERVWSLARYTMVTVGLDINTDSNTRQRDLCHIDAYITAMGQYAISNASGVQFATAMDALQVDSNIWASSADFKAVTVQLIREVVLQRGDTGLRLAAQYYQQLRDFTLGHFVSADAHGGLLYKPKDAQCGFVTPTPHGVSCSVNDLIDWPTSQRDGYVDGPVSSVINAYAVGALNAMADIAQWLGRAQDADTLSAQAAALAASMRAQLWDSRVGAFRDGLEGRAASHAAVHGSIWSAAHGVFGGNSTKEGARALVNYLQTQQPQGQLRCSCMGAYWLLRGLFRAGLTYAPAADLALLYLTGNSTTSWIAMMDKWGATTTMEAWSPSAKPNLSFSHPWCAAPAAIIPGFVVGVRPTAPRWANFTVRPQPGALLTMNARLPTPHGDIRVDFVQNTSTVTLALGVPMGSCARVCLPPPHTASAAASHLPQDANPRTTTTTTTASATRDISSSLWVDGISVPYALHGRMVCALSDVGPGSHTVRLSQQTTRVMTFTRR